MQRIFKYSGTQNITLTIDKELNILIYRMPSYVIILKSYALQKIVRFLAHPVVLFQSTKELSSCRVIKIQHVTTKTMH